MLFNLAALLLAAPLLAVYAGPDASPKYAAAGRAVAAKAVTVPNGRYFVKNVKTGLFLTYVRKSQSVFYSKKASPISFTRNGKYEVLSPSESNNKCLAAQWDYDVEVARFQTSL